MLFIWIRYKLYNKKYSIAIYSYALRANYVYLFMASKAGQGDCQMTQALGRYYVRYFYQTFNGTRTQWEGRYKSTLVDSVRYFLASKPIY